MNNANKFVTLLENVFVIISQISNAIGITQNTHQHSHLEEKNNVSLTFVAFIINWNNYNLLLAVDVKINVNQNINFFLF